MDARSTNPMPDRIDPVPDEVLRWVAGARGDGAPGYSKPPCDDAQAFARELLALRREVREYLRFEDNCGAWDAEEDAALYAEALERRKAIRTLLPKQKVPPA